MEKPGLVAVVGGGVAGVSCAHSLQAAGLGVRLFERAGALGGRCATQLWQGHLIDLGVQYFTAQSPQFKKELLTRLRQFRPIITPILDEKEKLVVSTKGPRFYVLQGNHYLTHVLARGLEIELNAPVDQLTFADGHIECRGEKFHAVVSALPGPETAALLQLPEPPVQYEPCLTAMLEYANDGREPGRLCYGRVLPEESPVILTSFCENHKAGRIIGNKTVFVAQASPSFSRTFAGQPPEDYLPLIIAEQEKLWHLPSGLCRASSIHVWTYGRPLPETRRPVQGRPGTFFCGDSRSGSTVEEVWLDGRRAAEEVLAYLGRPPAA